MLGSLWNFLKRHKRKFVFTGAVIGGGVLLWRYLKKKIGEYQELEADEYLSFTRRQLHFDNNQRTCNMSTFSLVPSLRARILSLLNCEQITQTLQNSPPNKLDLWEELKILSFSSAFVSVYSSCLLVVYLRVQLNIIGGYMYVANQRIPNGMAHDAPVIVEQSLQQDYLRQIEFLLDSGLKGLCATIKEATTSLLKDVSLKQLITIADFKLFISKLRRIVEFQQRNGDHRPQSSSLCVYLLPDNSRASTDTDEITCISGPLQKLLLETQDIVESVDFHTVLTVCLDTAFDQLEELVCNQLRRAEGLPLAKLIPVMAALINKVLSDQPNQIVLELLLKDQLKDFAGNIYESFSHVAEVKGR